MKDSDVIVLQEPQLTTADRVYLPQVMMGLGTTLKHLWNTVRPGGGRVVQYPEQTRDDLPASSGGVDKDAFKHIQTTYRGVHRLNKDEQGRVKCVACFMCSTACPARCIHIEAGESPWPDREKYPVKFDIDELRCIYCGMCEEACPCDAIELTSIIDLVSTTRQEMIYDKEKLLRIYDETRNAEPM
jgi:NADH-quinone oxidoreductase subunit I